jgi:hypothetical protein
MLHATSVTGCYRNIEQTLWCKPVLKGTPETIAVLEFTANLQCFCPSDSTVPKGVAEPGSARGELGFGVLQPHRPELLHP